MSIGSMSVFAKFERTANEKLCQECGAGMVEVDRCNENGTLFVWYQCSKDNCDGQWLQKNAHKSLRVI